jgi:MarR-like DNA-binding transcriptional regulator SgrR of sgrS sRNA
MGLVKQKLIAIPAEEWLQIEAIAGRGSTSKVILDLLKEALEHRQINTSPTSANQRITETDK